MASGTGPADRALDLIDRAVRWVALAGGTVLAGLMALTVVDVVLRYVFNAPIFGAHDVSQLALLTIVACTIAYGGRTGAHVAIDLLGMVAGPAVTRWTDAAVRAACAATLTLLAWRCYLNGVDAADYGEASNSLQIPFLPFYWLLGAGMLLYALVLLVELWAGLARRAT